MTRLFGYYAFHSLVNQIKKIFKTWVAAVFGVCLVLGLIFGFAMAKLDESYEEEIPKSEITEVMPEEMGVVESFIVDNQIEGVQIGETIYTVVIVGLILLFVVLADKNGSSVFIPADVNILFASPLSPQKVLLFRLLMQLGMMIFVTIYLFIEIPSLMTFGMTASSALIMIISFGMMFVFALMIQTWLFLFTSTRPKAKQFISYIPVVVVVLLVLIVFAYSKINNLNIIKAFIDVLTSKGSRFVPIIGWIKAAPFLMLEGKYLWLAVAFVAYIICILLFVKLILETKCDYYEDAMIKAEERVEMIERAKASGNAFSLGKKTKEVKERDNLTLKGKGENTYFFKEMYIRRKYAVSGIFTKKSIWYLVIGLLITVLPNIMFDFNSTLPCIAALGALIFLRTLSNPIIKDIKTDYFRLSPGNYWKKMFWSIFAGSINCLLDALPAVVLSLVCCLVTGGTVLENVAISLFGLLFIASLDFYSANTGAFIGLSLPDNTAANLKQVIQILFLYFGLIPDILIVAFNINSMSPIFIGLIVVLVNMLVGFFFMSMSPLFLWPGEKEAVDQSKIITKEECAQESKKISKLGFGLFIFLAVSTLIQVLLPRLIEKIAPAFLETDAAFWLLSFGPMYLVALPITYLIIRKLPKKEISKQKLKAIDVLKLVIVLFSLGYIANIVANLISSLIYIFSDFSLTNVVEVLTNNGPDWVQVLVIVIIGPLVEEFMFRKLTIDRLNVYGGKVAIIVSALLFGLFHGNLQQFIYATILGLVLGYTYQRTGNILYSYFLHMLFNLNGSIVASKIIASNNIPLTTAYLIILLAIILIGIVVTAINARNTKFIKAEKVLPKGSKLKTIWLNPGMLLMVVMCLGLAVLNIVQMF